MKHYSFYFSILLTGAPALAMELLLARKEAVTPNYSLVTNCNHGQEKINEETKQAVENELVYSKIVIAALSQKLAKYEAQSKQQEGHLRLTKLQDAGKNYYHGINGCAQDYAQALGNFTQVEQAQALDFDKTLTWYYLGRMYKEAKGVAADNSRAKIYFRKIVNFSALDKDQQEAVFMYLEQIALEEAEYAKATQNYHLGYSYDFGINNCPKNYTKAREHFELVEQAQAPRFDKALTWYYLGGIYFKGLDVSQDYKRAKSFFEKVVNSSALDQPGKDYVRNCLAQIAQDQTAHDQAKQNQDLGKDYYHGTTSGRPDYTRARELFELVEQAQVPRFDKALTWYYLGGIYFQGVGGVLQDYKRAKSFFEKVVNSSALDQPGKDYVRNCLAQIAQDQTAHDQAKQNQDLGKDYYHGTTSGSPDYTRARELFELVEQAQVPRFDKALTWYYLGGTYFHGVGGVLQDYKRAKSYFEKVVNSSALDQPSKDYVRNSLAQIRAAGA